MDKLYEYKCYRMENDVAALNSAVLFVQPLLSKKKQKTNQNPLLKVFFPAY